MTPNEIYKLPATSTTHELYELSGCYYNHLPEAGEPAFEWSGCETDRVEIRTVKYINYDGRRYWKIATVWFDGCPVMIIQNAGREGDDHAKRFVTDSARLIDMAKHIKSLVETKTLETINPDADLPELTTFYADSL